MDGRRQTTINELPIVYLDSSVFFAATNSPYGGSSKIFSEHKNKIMVCTSTFVLDETERNVIKKLPPLVTERFFTLQKLIEHFESISNPKELEKAEKVIVKKDAYVIADAKNLNATYLVTYDKKHFFTEKVNTYLNPTKVVTPGGLIKLLNL
jgi:putative PIN family toxin of toxin-antitoxin system